MTEPIQEGVPAALGEREARPMPGESPPTGGYAFAETVERFETPLLRYVAQTLGDEAMEAEDIVQETFLRLHRQVRAQGEASVRNMQGWLFRVAHNLAFNALRKRRRESRAPGGPNPAGSGPADALSDMAQREACDRALAELHRLPEGQKQVILLRVIHGMKMREISEVTGLTIGNASYRLSRGLQELARRLQADGII